MQCWHILHGRGLPAVESVLSFPISCHFGLLVLGCWGSINVFFPVLGSALPKPGLSSAEAGVGMPSEDPFFPQWRLAESVRSNRYRQVRGHVLGPAAHV